MRNISDNRFRGYQAYILRSVTFFSRKLCRLLDHMEEYGACALHAGYLRLQIHT